jgi:glycosyltransferase involved in cell wall biosynthesis
MADQDPMTGGCHYSFDCRGYQDQCGCCPQLGSTEKNDYSHEIWRRKEQYLSQIPICFIAPTSWGVNRIAQSSLFRRHRVELIPYPIDTSIFRPIDREIARDLLHLPFDKKVIFFGATYLEDRRKGMKQLLAALERLGELIDSGDWLKRDDLFLFVAGLNGKDLMSQINLPGKYSGLLNDELTLALAYQAADIFICPSIEEAGPLMIPEAMLCGAPVVAFNTGGAPDLIETMKNGYLARLGDPFDFAQGIYALLIADDLPAMSAAARSAALRAHTPSIVAQRHIELYQNLIKS